MSSAIIDSASAGDPARFHTLAALELGLAALPAAPRDHGSVAALVVRSDGGRRELPPRILLSREHGVLGDAWGRREGRKLDGQISVMQTAVADLIANHQPRALFGDNLFLNLDLSAPNLPPGSRLRAGSALLEVTPKPHTGCAKFKSRFGDEALRFVWKPELRERNLRGLFVFVVEEGEVAVGDPVDVLMRGGS